MKYKIAWPIVVLIICVLLSQTAWAGISLSPMILEITQPPGSSYSGVLFVTNTGDKAIVVEARVLGFIAPQGIPHFLEPASYYAYSGQNILSVKPQEKKVQAKETVLFHYRTDMPKDLKPYGGRYAGVVFRKIVSASEAQVRVAAQVASLFLLNPGGEVSSHLTIDRTRISQSKQNPRTVILEATVTNDGNIHASQDQMASLVNVLDEDGYIVDQFHLDSQTMLPGNTSIFREQWKVPENLPNGSYQFYLTIISFGALGTEPQPFSIMQTVKLKF